MREAAAERMKQSRPTRLLLIILPLLFLLLVGGLTARAQITVTGVLQNANGTIAPRTPVFFTPLSNPQILAPNVVGNATVSTRSGLSAEWSMSLVQGDYLMHWGAAAPSNYLRLAITNGTGTYGVWNFVTTSNAFVYTSPFSTQQLPDLTDVDIAATPDDGDVLTWVSAFGRWTNQPPTGGGSTTLSNLSDVDVAGVVNGQALVFDGTEWVPGSPAAAGSIATNNGVGTGTTLVNPTIIGGSLTNTFRSLKPSRLLILGDSQTDEGGLPGYYNWFSQYIWPRGRINATNRFSAVNVAEAGQLYQTELTEDEGARFRKLGTNENGYVAILLGINDMLAGRTALQTGADMTNLVNLYKTNGWKIIVGDLIGTNYLTNTVGALAEAVQFNTILSNAWAGGFIDHLVIQSTNTAITTSDGLHPNNAGAAAQAVQWAATLDPLMNEGSFDHGRSWLGTTYFQAAKSNYAAVRMSGGYMEMVEPAHLRWGGTYGASRYITAASTNGLDELYLGTYARDTIILSGDGASSRVGIRKRPDSGYALDVSGFAKVTALIATNQVEGILRGKSGSISTNTGIVQALYIYDEAPLVFLRDGTNYTWTGVQDNAWNNIFTAGSRSTGDYGIATANGRILFGFNGRTPHWYLSRTNLNTPWVSMGSQGAGSAIGAGENDFVMRIRDFTPGASFTNRAHIAVGDSGTAQVVINTNTVEMLLWPGGQEQRSMPLTNAAAFQPASSALTALATNNAASLTNMHQTNLVTGLQTWLAIPASIPMQRGLVPNPIMVQTNASATITSWVPVSGLPSNAYLVVSNSSGGNITITTTGTGRFYGTATNALVIGSGKIGVISVESMAGASTNIMGTVAQQ